MTLFNNTVYSNGNEEYDIILRVYYYRVLCRILHQIFIYFFDIDETINNNYRINYNRLTIFNSESHSSTRARIRVPITKEYSFRSQ